MLDCRGDLITQLRFDIDPKGEWQLKGSREPHLAFQLADALFVFQHTKNRDTKSDVASNMGLGHLPIFLYDVSPSRLLRTCCSQIPVATAISIVQTGKFTSRCPNLSASCISTPKFLIQ